LCCPRLGRDDSAAIGYNTEANGRCNTCGNRGTRFIEYLSASPLQQLVPEELKVCTDSAQRYSVTRQLLSFASLAADDVFVANKKL